ncbi:MAG: NAD(P)H-hydrate dehydratase [Lachnospiraceae bacterium]|nr:NAD(P)H-hydrate dehydratase [Lachnospiraceae bacterium]
MRIVVTKDQMKSAERAVIDECGIDAAVLMERAAAFAFDILSDNVHSCGHAVILCGMGNNGGDGMALGRILFEKGWEVDVLTAGDEKKRTAENEWQAGVLERISKGQAAPVPFTKEAADKTLAKGKNVTVIVDALLGIGQTRPPGGVFLEVVRWINSHEIFTMALDTPTGINTDTGLMYSEAVKADVTACFGALKSGLLLADGHRLSGRIYTDSCGIFYEGPDEKQRIIAYAMGGHEGVMDPAQWKEDAPFMPGLVMEQEDLSILLKRDPSGNKGTFGKIAIWAGNDEITGAAILSVKGAFASGAGYIRLLSDASNKDTVISAVPETVFANVNGGEKVIDDAIAFAQVIAAGCGIGRGEKSKQLLTILLDRLTVSDKKPFLVLDADILGMLSDEEGSADLWEKLSRTGCTTVMTPHMAEFSRLSGISIDDIRADRINVCKSFAKEKDIILVLKDDRTVICAPDGRYFINIYGNDGMAVAGSGDTLLGIIASCTGQLKNAFTGAAAGAAIHALAGDEAAGELGKAAMSPLDIVKYLPRVMKRIEDMGISHKDERTILS